MKSWQSLAVVSSFALLAACSQSSSNNNGSNEPAPGGDQGPTTPVEYGYVIDGYIEKAKVCIDGNNNFECDANEKPIETDAQGRFDLSGLKDKKLLAQVIAGISKDADDNGAAVNQSYILQASTGGLITPFTTLSLALKQQGVSQDAIDQLFLQLFNVNQQQASIDYIAENNSALQKHAKVLVKSVQEIAKNALKLAEFEPSAIEIKVQQLAWQQLTTEALTKLVEVAEQNSDADAAQLVTAWMTEVPALALTADEIKGTDDSSSGGNSSGSDGNSSGSDGNSSGSDGNSSGSDGNSSGSDGNSSGSDGNSSGSDGNSSGSDGNSSGSDGSGGNEVAQFSKLNAAGQTVANDATDYHCVVQNKDANDNLIAEADRNTWMLLIPADATYDSLGVTAPTGFSGTDKFWEYTWEPSKDPIFQGNFKEANGLTSQYNASSQIEIYVELLNQLNYCGYSDWTIPSVEQMQTLNTKPLQADASVKTLDATVFKNYSDFTTQVANRSESSDHLLTPYFWTSTRLLDDGEPEDSISAFKKYLHASETSPVEKVAVTNYGAGPYYALRAVRQDRFTHIDTAGEETTDQNWACIRDDRHDGRRHWINPQGDNLSVASANVATRIAEINNANTCGFNDWRLATNEEVLSLKPVLSNAHISFPVPTRDGDEEVWSDGDFIWLKAQEEGEYSYAAMHLKRLTDYVTDQRYMDQYSTPAHMLLVRDDLIAAAEFDQQMIKIAELNNLIEADESDFANNDVDDAVATTNELKQEVTEVKDLAVTLIARKSFLDQVTPLLPIAQQQLNALYVDQQTQARQDLLTAAQAANTQDATDYTTDLAQVQTWLDNLMIQYDALPMDVDGEEKARVLLAVLTLAEKLTVLYELDSTAYADEISAINQLVVDRKVEIAALPPVPLEGGYIKLGSDGSPVAVFNSVEEGWRCVQHSTAVDDFTTVTTWNLLLAEDQNLEKSGFDINQYKDRLDAVNAAALCGIDNWQVPSFALLQSLKTQDIVGKDEKTLDTSVFANHQQAVQQTPFYWAESAYYPETFRYADLDNDEQQDTNPAAGTKANARFFHQVTTYQKTESVCGDDRIRYQDRCYQKFDIEVTWAVANQACIELGATLVKESYLSNPAVDYPRLAEALGLVKESYWDPDYWLEEKSETSAYTLRESNDVWEKYNSGNSKTSTNNYICSSPLVALPQPAAPTGLTVDDSADTLDWTWVEGYEQAENYQYSIDAGVSWKMVDAKPIVIGNRDLAADQIRIKIPALENENRASAEAQPVESFTLDESKPYCFGGDFAAFVNDQCYVRFDTELNAADAASSCAGIAMEMVSKDLTNLAEIAEALELNDSGEKYLLKEKDSWGWSYGLYYSSGWSVDNAGTGSSTARKYICVRP